MERRPSKRDKSDSKATTNLIEKLMLLSKQRPTTSKSPKTPPNRKRTLKPDSNSKITTWLSKENQQSKRQKTERKTQNESKLKPLDITVKSEKSSNGVEKKSKSKSKSLKRNASFEKYGIAMPSFEKIVADQKKFDAHRENVKKLDIFDDNILHKTLARDCLDVQEYTGELLDCKHLSLHDLDEAFKSHRQTLSDIISGKKYSERHARFHKHIQEVSLSRDLRCSASLVVFTQDQKDRLLDLMRNEFDPDDKLTGYFFKVLLPELCLFIFMDEHGMSKRKASAYLDKRPLD